MEKEESILSSSKELTYWIPTWFLFNIHILASHWPFNFCMPVVNPFLYYYREQCIRGRGEGGSGGRDCGSIRQSSTQDGGRGGQSGGGQRLRPIEGNQQREEKEGVFN